MQFSDSVQLNSKNCRKGVFVLFDLETDLFALKCSVSGPKQRERERFGE